ncbi:MAG: enoyl-CoA hydratase [Betaproteobacteria bacterium]|nr:MAG: enoyl-CoA hydratase [Betaproteobacteria bacterium]
MNAAAEVRYFPQTQFNQIETRFDPEFGVLWGLMSPKPRPTFNPSLLAELRGYVDSIIQPGGLIWHEGRQEVINYAVIASKVPGVFSLGGDLSLFRLAIANQDRNMLVQYGRKCIDNLFPWSRNCDLPLTTIALVQGDALGGGFECALSASVLVAEESARMGFPEILFNLFPGMGAYSFLARKVGRRVTDELVTSGNMYTARQLYDLGVVDVLAPDGLGEATLYSFVRKHARTPNGRRALEMVRREVEPVTHEELMRIVNIWADAALRLSERDLRMMERLVRAQSRSAETLVDVPIATVTPLQRVG